MRKPEWHEVGMMLFGLFMWFTLTIDKTLFTAGDNEVYASYIAIVKNQQNLANISLIVSIIILISFYIRNYTALFFVSALGFLYFLFVSASFWINYPNIASGVMLLVAIYLGVQMYHLIDMSEEVKKEKILRNSEYSYNEHDNEGREKNDGTESKDSNTSSRKED